MHSSMAVMGLRFGIVLLLNVAGTALLSRKIGPEIWGVFAFAQFLMSAAQELLGGGFSVFLIRRQQEPTVSVIGSMLTVQGSIGLAVLLILVPVSAFAEARLGMGAQFLLLASAVFAFTCALRALPVALLERKMQYTRVAAIEVLEPAVFFTTALLCVHSGMLLEGLAIAVLARTVLSVSCAYVLHPIPLRPRWDRTAVAEAFTFGRTIFGASFMNVALLAIPVTILPAVASVQAVGLAQMAFRLYTALLFPTAAVLRINMSAFSRLADQPEEMSNTMRKTVRMLTAAVVPVIIVFASTAPLWVPKVLGSAWTELSALLLITAPAYMLASVFWGVLSPALFVRGKGAVVFRYQVALLIVYGLLTAVFAARFGALGIAGAWAAAHVLLAPMIFRAFRLAEILDRTVVAQFVLAIVAGVSMYWLASEGLMGPSVLCLFAYLGAWIIINRTLLTSVGRNLWQWQLAGGIS
jgi:lipopolysaccharide exporter